MIEEKYLFRLAVKAYQIVALVVISMLTLLIVKLYLDGGFSGYLWSLIAITSSCATMLILSFDSKKDR